MAVGPLAGSYIAAFDALPEGERPNLWAVAELPLASNPMPDELLEQLRVSRVMCIAEEHVQRGGFGSEVALKLVDEGLKLSSFIHHFARAHHYERYGSQSYLRQLSGLDAASLIAALTRTATGGTRV